MREIRTVEEFSRYLLTSDPAVLSSVLSTYSAPKFTITTAEELPWTLDGEAGGTHTVAEIEALPNGYTIVHGA